MMKAKRGRRPGISSCYENNEVLGITRWFTLLVLPYLCILLDTHVQRSVHSDYCLLMDQ